MSRGDRAPHAPGALRVLGALGVVAFLAGLASEPAHGAMGAKVAGDAPGARAARSLQVDAPSATLEEIATCLRGTDRLLLVVLIDESGSLKTTDPTNERVTAARLALRSFASLSSTSVAGHRPSVDVLLAGFSSGFTEVMPWTALDDRRIDQVEAAVGGFAARNSGLDTDFPTALLGAQRALAARSADLSERAATEPCKAVLLFTDGRYDVEAGDTPARHEAGTEKEYAPGVSLLDPANGPVVEAAGRDLLCRSDGTGLADRLRGDGAAVVTVALAAQIDAADQEFLRALSTGEGAGVSCGALRGAGTGAYLGAADLTEVVPAFARVATSIAGATEAPGEAVVETCATTRCERGERRFELDPILRRFTILADTAAAGVTAEIRGPAGADPLVMVAGEGGSEVLDGATLSWTWVADTTVEIDADLPESSEEWAGRWSVTFVDPTGANAAVRPRADIFLYSGWSPSLPVPARLLRGESAVVTVVVVDAGGDRVSGEALADSGARVDATLTDPTTGEKQPVTVDGPDPQGRFRATYAVAADLKSALLDLDVRLTARTASGVALAPSTGRYEVEVSVPDLYPHVTASEIRLTSVRGTGTARGTIEIVGGRDRAGCVWFADAEVVSFPREARSFSVALSPRASEEKCLKIVAGESRSVEVRVRPEAPSEGVVRGVLTVHVSAKDEIDELPVSVPFSFDVAPPIDQVTRAGLFVAILLPGVLLPVGVLMLVNRRLARFEAPSRVVVARVPVSVERTVDRVVRAYTAQEDAAVPIRTRSAGGIRDGLHVDPSLLVSLGEGARRVKTVSHEGLTIHARASRHPFGEPYGSVQCDRPFAAGGPLSASSDAPDRLPLALPGSWVFVLGGVPRAGEDGSEGDGDVAGGATGGPEDDGAWISGEVVVFLPAERVDEGLEAVIHFVGSRLPVVANDVAANRERRRKT